MPLARSVSQMSRACSSGMLVIAQAIAFELPNTSFVAAVRLELRSELRVSVLEHGVEAGGRNSYRDCAPFVGPKVPR